MGDASRPSSLEQALAAALAPGDEVHLDGTWAEAQAAVRELALRPAKRLRPRLLLLGYELAGGALPPPAGLWRFAAGLEVLHTFLLIHDDVADRSQVRRGGATLHRSLAPGGRGGEDLAVVAGDHLFARAVEVLLSSGLAGSSRATLHYLAVCRHTAVGQYLDLALARRPLAQVTPFDALKVADLKTAKYSFAAPLACGALLGGAPTPLVDALSRAGRLAGLAFQLRDDLLGMAGDAAVCGKPGDADLVEGKRTFPLLMAYRRASPQERRVLDALGTGVGAAAIARARDVIRARGGVAATERAIERTSRAALRLLDTLPVPRARIEPLAALVTRLAQRAA